VADVISRVPDTHETPNGGWSSNSLCRAVGEHLDYWTGAGEIHSDATLVWPIIMKAVYEKLDGDL